MSSFTPQEAWKIHPTSKQIIAVRFNGDTRIIGEVNEAEWSPSIPGYRPNADGRLIESAPEMYMLLQRCAQLQPVSTDEIWEVLDRIDDYVYHPDYADDDHEFPRVQKIINEPPKPAPKRKRVGYFQRLACALFGEDVND